MSHRYLFNNINANKIVSKSLYIYMYTIFTFLMFDFSKMH